MAWQKLGQLYEPRPVHPLLLSHAANPVPVHLHDDVFRIFYSGRDAENRSSVGYVHIDLSSLKLLYVHDQPVFTYGPAGSFYSHGVSLGNLYHVNGTDYLLFMGWQIPENGHWRGDIGRLIMRNSLDLTLDPSEAFMASDETDPVSLSYPWIIDIQGRYRMWYGSTVTWDFGNGEMLHVLKGAVSDNGKHWTRGGPAVPFVPGEAQAFSRPSVVVGPQGYEMWFSYRGNRDRYKIGYATSTDGDQWQLRLGDAGIAPSANGWDAEMIEYPYVFEHRGRRYMLYNGNSYGKTGFGVAIWEAY